MFTWAQLKEHLTQASEDQLSKPVTGLIDGMPWHPNCYQIALPDDPDLPNTPYLIFD